MRPRAIMMGSALWMGLAGLTLLFVPLEAAPLLGLGGSPDSEASLQLAGGLLLAFGYMNWTGRSAIYGGIYGRPLTLGNAFAAIFTALGLVQAQLARDPQTVATAVPGWIVAGGFAVQAMAFLRLLFGFWPALNLRDSSHDNP